MSKLILENIWKKFDGDWILKDINLETNDNEFIVILGPSGCGKTTLLRIIAGLENPDKGRVILDGKDITNRSPKERNISMIFQNYPVYPHLSVYDNISVPLKLKKYPKDQIQDQVNSISEKVSIANLLSRKTSNLSGGELQRVAIGKALIKNPSIFLMDEPLSDLDTEIKIAVKHLIKTIHDKEEQLIFYVTHDQIEALSLADRIAILNDKEVVQFTNPSEIYNKPKNLFVAEFIGYPKINVMLCDILKENGNIKLLTSFGVIDIKFHKDKLSDYKNSKIFAGIRPEAIVVSVSNIDKNHLSAKIEKMEFMGNHYIIWLKESRDFKIVVNEGMNFHNFSDISFIIGENNLIFFDYKNHLRI